MISSYNEAFSIVETTAAGKEKPNKLEAETQQRKMSSEKSERISCQLTGGSDGVLDEESKSKACRCGVKAVQEI